jgi:hypothetical protein
MVIVCPDVFLSERVTVVFYGTHIRALFVQICEYTSRCTAVQYEGFTIKTQDL